MIVSTAFRRMVLATTLSLVAFAHPSEIWAQSGGQLGAEPDAPTSSTPTLLFDEAERTEIEIIVREYLLANPEVIVEVIQTIRARQEQQAADQRREALQDQADALLASATSPSVGDPDASVVLVEFSDYNCGFCKRMVSTVNELIETQTDFRVVFKELPILAESSHVAARAALAANRQDRYLDFHVALMEFRGQMSEEAIFAIAGRMGLDVDQLRRDMDHPSVTAEIEQNRALAQSIGVSGTPAFVLDGELIPGAVPIEVLRARISDARRG